MSVSRKHRAVIGTVVFLLSVPLATLFVDEISRVYTAEALAAGLVAVFNVDLAVRMVGHFSFEVKANGGSLDYPLFWLPVAVPVGGAVTLWLLYGTLSAAAGGLVYGFIGTLACIVLVVPVLTGYRESRSA